MTEVMPCYKAKHFSKFSAICQERSSMGTNFSGSGPV